MQMMRNLLILPSLLVFFIASPTLLKSFAQPEDLVCTSPSSTTVAAVQAFCCGKETWIPLLLSGETNNQELYARARIVGVVVAVQAGMIVIVGSLSMMCSFDGSERGLKMQMSGAAKRNLNAAFYLMKEYPAKALLLICLSLSVKCINTLFGDAWTELGYVHAIRNLGIPYSQRNDSMALTFPRYHYILTLTSFLAST